MHYALAHSSALVDGAIIDLTTLRDDGASHDTELVRLKELLQILGVTHVKDPTAMCDTGEHPLEVWFTAGDEERS